MKKKEQPISDEILCGWFSLNVPVIDVPFEHFGEVKAYRYEDEHGHKKFCVIYSSPEYVYYYDKLEKALRQTGNGYTWIMDYEKNIIGGATDGSEVIYWNFEGERIDIEDSSD